mgnify:CR=1 FL=1
MSIFGRRTRRVNPRSTRRGRTNARIAAHLRRVRAENKKGKALRANRPTEKQKKIKRPAVDPRPGSRANASIVRRLADAKRLTNVAAKAKKGTKNITDVLVAAKTAAGRTKGPKSKRGPRA